MRWLKIIVGEWTSGHVRHLVILILFSMIINLIVMTT